MILDIHTHHPAPQPCGVIAVNPSEFQPIPDQFYSIGIHPWDTGGEINEDTWESMEKYASDPQVVAIGECGIDLLKGGPLFKQMQVFKRQIDLSEKIHKPLIIHDVRAHDVIVGLKRDLKPTQQWMVHGFRGKPTVAKMLNDAGIWLSFGEKFNPLSLQSVPIEMILAETDESEMSIFEIIKTLSAVKGTDLTQDIARNVGRFINFAS